MAHRDFEVSTPFERRPLAFFALVALPALAATAGCGSSTPPPEDTYVNATLKPAVDSMNNDLCDIGSATTGLLIGMPGASSAVSPATVDDGNAGVDITCQVRAGFTVSLVAVSTDATTGGGSIAIQGNVDSTSTSSAISAQLSDPTLGDAFSESDCTLVPKYLGGTIPTAPPIAPGRIWSHLSCAHMVSTMGKSKVIGSTTVNETCDVEADFLFENCDQ